MRNGTSLGFHSHNPATPLVKNFHPPQSAIRPFSQLHSPISRASNGNSFGDRKLSSFGGGKNLSATQAESILVLRGKRNQTGSRLTQANRAIHMSAEQSRSLFAHPNEDHVTPFKDESDACEGIRGAFGTDSASSPNKRLRVYSAVSSSPTTKMRNATKIKN